MYEVSSDYFTPTARQVWHIMFLWSHDGILMSFHSNAVNLKVNYGNDLIDSFLLVYPYVYVWIRKQRITKMKMKKNTNSKDDELKCTTF